MELTAFNCVPYGAGLPDDGLSADSEGFFDYHASILDRDRFVLRRTWSAVGSPNTTPFTPFGTIE